MSGETETETETTTEDTVTRTTIPALPNPPRLTGDPQIDSVAQAQWNAEIFKQSLRSAETLNALNGDAGDLDPNNLPDPGATNLATAQATANSAYQLAAVANTRANKLRYAGSVTVSDAATTGVVTFTTAEADTSYFVLVTPSAKTGSPAATSAVIDSMAKTAANVTLTLQAAPGAGTSRTFDVFVVRNPT